jgi:hypothetical protein
MTRLEISVAVHPPRPVTDNRPTAGKAVVTKPLMMGSTTRPTSSSAGSSIESSPVPTSAAHPSAHSAINHGYVAVFRMYLLTMMCHS